MAETYLFPASPQYTRNIRKLQNEDPAEADTIFNPLIEALIGNIHWLRLHGESSDRIIASLITDLEITIPAAGWTADTQGNYKYRLDMGLECVTDKMIPQVTVLPAGEGVAVACGLCPVAETLDGILRLRCIAAPSGDIPARLTLIQVGTGSGGGSGSWGGAAGIPLATESTPGAVMPGIGLTVGPDGALNLDIATDEEVRQLLEGRDPQ